MHRTILGSDDIMEYIVRKKVWSILPQLWNAFFIGISEYII